MADASKMTSFNKLRRQNSYVAGARKHSQMVEDALKKVLPREAWPDLERLLANVLKHESFTMISDAHLTSLRKQRQRKKDQ